MDKVVLIGGIIHDFGKLDKLSDEELGKKIRAYMADTREQEWDLWDHHELVGISAFWSDVEQNITKKLI